MQNEEKYGVKLETDYSGLQKDLTKAEKIADAFSKKIEKLKTNVQKVSSKTSLKMPTPGDKYQQFEKELWGNWGKENQIPVDIKPVNEAQLDTLKAKLDELKQKYQELKSVGKDEKSAEMLKLAEDISKVTSKMEKLNQAMDETKKHSQNAEKGIKSLGNNLQSTFSNGVSRVKRFALSLFGIQSIWRLISRASSEALATNQYQTSRLSVTWNALGQVMMPIVERLITGFQYVAIFIGKVIYLLTGYNALAKTTTKNINGTTKAIKGMSKSLGGFDELTNLDNETGGTGLSAGLKSDLAAIKDFQDKIKQVEEFMKKSGITAFILKLKDAVQYLWQEILKPFWDTLLKPMFEWLGNHPDVLKTAFAVFLGSKLIKNIGKILGSGTSLTGLSGISQLLLGIAAIGVITVAIKVIHDDVEKTKKAIEGTAKAGDKYYETQDKLQKQAMKTKATTEEVTTQFNNLNNMVGLNTSAINTNIKGIEDMTTWDKILDTFLLDGSGTWNLNTQKIIENSEELGLNVNKMNALARQGKLSDDQQKQWIETLKNTIPQLEKQREKLVKGSEEYDTMGETIDKAKNSLKKFEDGSITAQTPLGELVGKITDGADKVVNWKDNLQSFTDKMTDTAKNWKNLTFEEKAVKIKASIETVVTNITSTISNITNAFQKAMKNNPLAKVLGKLNSFDVGTNYVPNDQLAYIHKGEAIVPKKFNSKEYFGNSNNQEVVRAIENLQRTLEEKDMNTYISKSDIGRASVDYINSQNRIMGRSVV